MEIILVDDGSTDHITLASINRVKNKKNVIVLTQKNSGPSKARNNGILKAKGEWIGFCDSDDKIDSNNLLSLLEKLPSYRQFDMLVFGWNIAYSDINKISRSIQLESQNIRGSNNIINKTIISLSDDGRMYNLWNKLYRREIIEKNNLKLKNSLKFGEDLLFNLDLLSTSQYISCINIKPYYTYLDNSKTSIVRSTKLDLNFRKENVKGLLAFANNSNGNINSAVELIKLRWLISFCLAIVSQNTNTYNKLKQIKLIYKNNLLIPRYKCKKGIISYKKYIILKIFSLIMLIPIFNIFFIYTLFIYKKISINSTKIRNIKLNKILD